LVKREARLLRGMLYFRLISMWGDVPYFENVPASIAENETFYNLPRTPIATVKDKILADLTYAYDKILHPRAGAGRGSKPAALAFRGKVQLFWGSWHKYGWPELTTFVADPGEAIAAFTAAAADFKLVIDYPGLTLFRNGEPGQIDALGKADILPNYFYLFQPIANNDPEIIMSFNHGGTGTGQGEELMREFGTRTQQTAQGFVKPRFMLANRYQLITTGENAPALIPDGGALPPSTPTNTLPPRTMLNSAVNPQSYADRDYRMKSTILWNYEVMMGMASLKSTGFAPFIYPNPGQQNVYIDGAGPYTTVNADNNNTGYIFRKFVRNYAGQDRSDGDYSFPVMRLADVYLMYAEASNEVSGPQPDAIDLVNKVRHRGNLPPLDGAHTASADAFFAAIEQERVVELVGEGQRSFDLRRWRAIQRAWDPDGTNQGTQTKDTRNNNRDLFYRNASELDYQKAYIFRIPPGERDKNPNLTQNAPWL
jgi:starch-binding outer membrane protein, SusD/RagB family